jgi:hypothetical protein
MTLQERTAFAEDAATIPRRGDDPRPALGSHRRSGSRRATSRWPGRCISRGRVGGCCTLISIVFAVEQSRHGNRKENRDNPELKALTTEKLANRGGSFRRAETGMRKASTAERSWPSTSSAAGLAGAKRTR